MDIAAGQERAGDHHATTQLLPDLDRLNVRIYVHIFTWSGLPNLASADKNSYHIWPANPES